MSVGDMIAFKISTKRRTDILLGLSSTVAV